jgi:acyl-CoA thioesterase
MSFADVVSALAPEGESYVIDAPEDWSQGRTLYGGMTAALGYEAVKRAHGDLPPLRSAQFTFVGPASGRLRFTSPLLRRGRSSAIFASECVNDDGVVARAVFVCGGARESKVAHDYLPMPQVEAPEACRSFRKEGAAASRGFWNNFETRLAAGGRIMEQSAPRPEFGVWTRFLDVGAADPITALLALADCLPPAAMVHFPQPGPISTMTWTVDVTAPPTNVDAWHLLWASSEHAAQGYSMQAMTLWDEAGRPLAVGRQAVAIFV